MGINEELARERNRAAAERTLMAWIRTCLSLISFGFGLDKIVAAIERRNAGAAGRAHLSVQLVAIGFVITGIAAMLAATLQHRQTMRRLRHHEYTYVEHSSIAMATAIALMLIGTLALGLLLAGAA